MHRAITLAAIGAVVILSGCERALKDGEHREYYVKPAPVCQTARDRHGRLIPGHIVCDPRRAPVVGTRIVRTKAPTNTE